MYKINKSIILLLVASLIVVPLCVSGCTTPGIKHYTLATGGTAGTYFPVGEGIAQSVNQGNLGFNIIVKSTGGSVENCRLLANKSVNFAMVQNDVAFAAVNGKRNFSSGALTNIEGVACLYPETIQIVTLKSTGIKSITDLKGKKVVMGDKGSGSWFNALEILAAYGLTENDVQPEFANLTRASEMLKNGQVAAVFWTGGIPTTPISNLALTNNIYIVPISGTERNMLIKNSPFYVNDTIKSGTYNNLNEDIETFSVMAMLVADKDVSADDIYNLLKAMYDPNAPLKNSTKIAEMITKETGLKGMSIPLHPGAKKYFEEQDMEV